MDILLYLIKVYVEAAKFARNCYEESFNLINWKRDMDVEEYI